jgi:hypothetical protein
VAKNKTVPDASVREKWILATMAVVILWMGINSPFITRRTAAATQSVMDQVEPQRAYEAAAPTSTIPQAKTISIIAKPQAKNVSAGASTQEKNPSSSAATFSVERLEIH